MSIRSLSTQSLNQNWLFRNPSVRNMSSMHNYDLVLSKRTVTNPTKQNFYTSLIGSSSNIQYPRLTTLFPSIERKHPHPVSHVIKKASPTLIKGMINKKEPVENSPMKDIANNPQLIEFFNLRKTNITDLILKSPSVNELKIMSVQFRSHPSHKESEGSTFLVTPEAVKNLVHLFRSLGIPESRLTLSDRGYALYTRLGTGLLGLVNKTSKRILIEALTFYNGEFTRIMVLVYLGYGCTVWYMAAKGLYGSPLPTVLYPQDASYVDFFRESFSHPLYQKLSFIETKYLMNDLLKSFETFNPFTQQIEVPLTGVSEASSSSSSSQIASSSQIGGSTPLQLPTPEIDSSPEVSVIERPPHRFSENTRAAIKLGLTMSIFLASGVLMSEVANLVDKLL